MSVTPSPSATLYDPAPLEEMANQVRSQVIPWEVNLSLINMTNKCDPWVNWGTFEKLNLLCLPCPHGCHKKKKKLKAYQRGRMITQEQLDLIRAYDKKDPYVMDSLLERVRFFYVLDFF